jgi:hypothetical protein
MLPLIQSGLPHPATGVSPAITNKIKKICETREESCRCRKLHPCSSGSVLVFVEDAAESINSADVEVVESVRFGDRLAQLA